MGNTMENMPNDEPLELEALASTLQARRASQVQETDTGTETETIPLQRSRAVPIPIRGRAGAPPAELTAEQRPIGGDLIGGKLVAEPEDSVGLSQVTSPERDELDLSLEMDLDMELDLELEPELMALAENLDPLSQPDSFSPFSSSDVSSHWSSSTVSPVPVHVPVKCTASPPKLKVKPVALGTGSGSGKGSGKGSGTGYDMPFPYPAKIALCPQQRLYYIFSLVDSMNLQLEKKRRKTPEPLKNAGKKSATGAVPKAKNKNKEKENLNLNLNLKKKTKPMQSAEKTAKTNPSSQAKPKKYYIMNIQAKPINLSSKTNQQFMKEKMSKQQNVKRRQDQDLEPFIDLDTDCELGMEHLEQYRAKASRRDSEGNRNDRNPSEKRSSETDTTDTADPADTTDTADTRDTTDTTDTRDTTDSEKPKSLLYSVSDSSSNSDEATLEEKSSSETLVLKTKRYNCTLGSDNTRTGKRSTDGGNQDSKISGSNGGKNATGAATREGYGCLSGAMPYDLSVNRNRSTAIYAALNMTPPSSDDSNQAPADPSPALATGSPLDSSLGMPRHSFVGCPSLSSIGEQKLRHSSHPSGKSVRLGLRVHLPAKENPKKRRQDNLKDRLEMKRIRALVLGKSEKIAKNENPHPHPHPHKVQKAKKKTKKTKREEPRPTEFLLPTEFDPPARLSPAPTIPIAPRVGGRCYQLPAEDFAREDIVEPPTVEPLKNKLMTRHLMPMKSRLPKPALPQNPMGPVFLLRPKGCTDSLPQELAGSASKEFESDFRSFDSSWNGVLGRSKFRDSGSDGFRSWAGLASDDDGMSSTSGDSSTRAETDADTKRSSAGVGKRPPRYKGQKIPRQGDFRSYFELDEISVKILWTVAHYRPNVSGLHDRILDYMVKFYHSRNPAEDELIFQWYLLEGFYPLFYLLERPLEELTRSSDKQLDTRIHVFIESSRDSPAVSTTVTEQMAKYMVCAYYRVLYHYAVHTEMEILSRGLLRCRFAVNVVEVFMAEQRKRPVGGTVDGFELYNWAQVHEGRLKSILMEPLRTGIERATQAEAMGLCVRTPNSECYHEFYVNRQFPRPDFLAINCTRAGIRRCFSKLTAETAPPDGFVCPIQGCCEYLSPNLVLSHFVTHHCRRLEELWMGDRMICLFSPVSYPPRMYFCTSMLAILDGKHRSPPAHRPRYIRHVALPTRELYFAEHHLVLVMYARIDKRQLGIECETSETDNGTETEDNTDSIPWIVAKKESSSSADDRKVTDENAARSVPESEPDPEPEPEPDGDNQLYVFWLMSHDKLPRDMKVRLYLYALERGVAGSKHQNLLKPIRMSKFIDVPDMIMNSEDSCLILDHPTMVFLTDNFKDIMYVDVRPVYGQRYDARESNDEMWVVQP